MTRCLDAWAVLAWLRGERPAAQRVRDALRARPVMSWINLGEVYYVAARADGADRASEMVSTLRRQLRLELPSAQRVLEAARIKATSRVSYADAFAIATAIAQGATLLTGDAEILAGDPSWPTEDIR